MVLLESVAYHAYFIGFIPVPVREVAQAYARDVNADHRMDSFRTSAQIVAERQKARFAAPEDAWNMIPAVPVHDICKNSARWPPKQCIVREDHVARIRKASHLPRTGEDPIEVVARIFRYSTYLERRVGAAFATAGLSRNEADLLAALLRSPERLVPPSRLAAALICSTGTMTNRLDRLEKARLIRRHDDPHDRRGVLIELTPQGRKTIATAIAARDAIGDLVPGLTTPERRQLATLLRKLMLEVEQPPRGESEASLRHK